MAVRQPSKWYDYSGMIGDEKVGVAILDNPRTRAVLPFHRSAFTNDRRRMAR
jgi:hypothetical protein